jgi:hypothetical protein
MHLHITRNKMLYIPILVHTTDTVYTKTHEAWMHFEHVESKVAQTENTELGKTRQFFFSFDE